MLFSLEGIAPFEAVAARTGADLIPLRPNLIDRAWESQPNPPSAPITPHPEHFAGESSASKRARIASMLQKQRVDTVLLTAPHSLAWLFNIRGGDVHASPLPLGRALLSSDGTATLFVAPEKTDDALRAHLGSDIQIAPETDIESALSFLGSTGARVMVDPKLCPVAYIQTLKEAGASPVLAPDPCALPRATKTTNELEGTRTAHIRDGAAVTTFLHWLSNSASTGTVTEISAAQKLEEFRRKTNALRDVSFDTISGSGAHGAVVHYRVNTSTDQPLVQDSLYLVDSGGQYQDGTTDITRTVAIGTPTREMAERYTLVLRGHIALATARFPAGTSGHQIDAFARRPLWEAGLDYDHGTGHGVGSFLGVHEGPQNISKKPIHQPLLPGMICSNEPGYYKTGEYGIRIENLVIVTEPSVPEGGERPMMAFETITLVPLERELILPAMLTASELAWVNAYHLKVADALLPHLDGDVAEWLQTRTAPL